MLWTIFALLSLLWPIGMMTSYALGGFIHGLLLVTMTAILVRSIEGRPPV